MHIEKPKHDFLDAQHTREILQIFLQQPTPKEMPPCQGCQNHVSHKCSITCSDAKTALSTEPDVHPIETNVVPLVYGLASTRLTQTCWSCEGHMDSDNNLIKLPRVSFYTSSAVYPQLLHRHLSKLGMDKKLAYAWLVVLTDYAQTWGQTYSIIPDLTFIKKSVSLGALQNDLKIIADNLQEKMKFEARLMINELDQWLQQNSRQ
ncbi:MAG: hypothetical protein OEW97_06320 [Gammaproteobacteria bacterium]|nr:hypothetical protein [Gammaproteobacteria bacterium]